MLFSFPWSRTETEYSGMSAPWRQIAIMFALLLTALLIFLLTTGGVAAQKTSTTEEETKESLRLQEKRLLEIRENMKLNIDRLETVREREKSLVEELDKLEYELEYLNTQIRILTLQKKQLAADMEEIRQEITRRKFEITQQEELLGKRLQVIYRRGEWTALRVILNADSISEIAHMMRMMKFVAQVDLTLIRQHRRWVTILSERSEELAQLERKVAATTVEISARQGDMIKKKRVREVFLEKIRTQRDEFEKRQVRLENAARELETLIEQQADSSQTGAFETQKGRLPWPVRGKVKVLFGRRINPRFQTYTFSNGIHISADSGTPVGSIADGVIRFAGWFQGYGNLVIVQHDDNYYSLYGHLSEISVSVGTEVKQLAIVGRVGDTSSDSGYVLYLEIRQKSTPLNPQKWLKKK